MKKILSVVLVFAMLLSLCTVFAQEEYSSDAHIEYGYDKSYDETANAKEETSSKYDGIESRYDSSHDERANGDINDSSESKTINVFLNGKQLDFDVAPSIINGRTMVPLRVIFEALGMVVTWDASTQTAIGQNNNTTIKITIGKDHLLKNNSIVALDSPAVIVSGRTLVPVRAIAESLDCKVEWYGEARVVEILK